MSDAPQRRKQPQTPNSFAEMAAKAAQRTVSNRPAPPPVPSVRLQPPPVQPGFGPPTRGARSGYPHNGDSGLIHLNSFAPDAFQIADAQRVTAPPTSRRSQLESNPFAKKGSRGLFVGFAAGLVVVGAAYGLAVKRGIAPVAVGRSLIASIRNWDSPPTTPSFSVNETKAATDTTSLVAASKVATEPTIRGVDPSNLPAVTGAGTVTPGEATDVLTQAKVATRAKPAFRPEPAPAAAPAPKAEKPEPVAVAPAPKAAPKPPPEPEPTGLAGAIKKAVGPQEAPQPVAAEVPETPAMRGDIPETPPQGAIQGAIGSHRQAARACLEGHDSPSRATIVFGSNGKVQSVNVAGPAAGTPAEACISRTLSKAAVGAFRRPTFSVTTTISPP